MRYRPFGSTGIEVSELVFGGGAVGGLLIDAEDDIKLATIKRALSAGINWIDTAPSYGNGQSEQALGSILTLLDKKADAQPYVSTKVNIDTRDLYDLAGQVERSLHGSLERLNLPKVTLLQLHNPIGTQSQGRTIGLGEVLKPHGVLDAMEAMRDQGLIEHFGITALGDVAALTKVIKSNRIASAQVYYNLLNPSAGQSMPAAWPHYNFTGIIDTCVEHQVATMNIRVFAAGVIATDARHGREQPLTPGDSVESETRKAKMIFEELGDDYGTRAQTALRFALARERLSCIVFGLATPAHLEEALSAQKLGPLPSEAMARINRIHAAYVH
ncbi:MAG: aldo/keto reductase [bacterium]